MKRPFWRIKPTGKKPSRPVSRKLGRTSGGAGDSKSSGGPSGSPVVVGLGNPGRSYERTRHNIGFLVADELARRHGGGFRKGKRAEVAPVGMPSSGTVTLVKPQTYMNNSGAALGGYKVGDLIVVHDDLDLLPGTVRVKVGGGAGGHNGLRSIISQLGPDFVRVRVGIGRPPAGATVTDYVLGKMDPAVRGVVEEAADAVEAVIESGPEAAMNHFNVRV